jgi:hypothetical protein
LQTQYPLANNVLTEQLAPWHSPSETPRPLYTLEPNRSPHLYAAHTIKPFINPKPFPQTPIETLADPPPHYLYVEPLPQPPKITNLSSPKNILFAKQRDFPRFPQNNKLHLVTLFPVDLRVHPFSELPPKKVKPSKSFKFHPVDHHFSLFSSSPN